MKKELAQHERELLKALFDKEIEILDDISLLNRTGASPEELDQLFVRWELHRHNRTLVEHAFELDEDEK